MKKRTKPEEEKLQERTQKLTKQKEADDVASQNVDKTSENEDELPEDPFEDEFQEEAIYENDEQMEEETEDRMEEEQEEQDEKEGEFIEENDEEVDTQPKKIWRPGIDQLQEGEVLEHDNTAYEMLHTLNLEWSCLSFDVIPDKLGMERSRFPLTAYFVTGTQADTIQNNKLFVLKLSQMYKTKYDNNSDEEESEGEDNLDEDPLIESRFVKHPGCVNRVKIMPQEPHVVATWSEDAHVYLWDLSLHIQALDSPPTSKLTSAPIKQLSGHTAEGYALDWSNLAKGRLVSGGCDKQIFVSDPHSGTTWIQDMTPFKGHQASVEDLQWSATEQTVFASCSADKTIKIWDTRMKKGAAVSWQAADCDVNCISWNRKVAYLLASGSDDGALKIWDLRSLKEKKDAECVGHFKWHTDQITSVQWDPNDESVIAASGADDQVSVWDLSMESDPESTVTFDQNVEVPPQLLFLHQGQKDVKEVRWHPQIPGVLASTGEDSFNIWKPSIETGEEPQETTVQMN